MLPAVRGQPRGRAPARARARVVPRAGCSGAPSDAAADGSRSRPACPNAWPFRPGARPVARARPSGARAVMGCGADRPRRCACAPAPRTPGAEPGPCSTRCSGRVVAHRGGVLLVHRCPRRPGRHDDGARPRRRTGRDGRRARRAAGEDACCVLLASRRAGGRLRDAPRPRACAGRGGAPVVRTPSSAAFSVLRARAALLGEPAPTLVSGPEQDLVLGDLLAGHVAGEGVPLAVARRPCRPTALGLRAFRDELRDLLMRAAERGLAPGGPRRRSGDAHGRPAWAGRRRGSTRSTSTSTALRAGTPDAGRALRPGGRRRRGARRRCSPGRTRCRSAPAALGPGRRRRLPGGDGRRRRGCCTCSPTTAPRLVLLADPDARRADVPWRQRRRWSGARRLRARRGASARSVPATDRAAPRRGGTAPCACVTVATAGDRRASARCGRRRRGEAAVAARSVPTDEGTAPRADGPGRGAAGARRRRSSRTTLRARTPVRRARRGARWPSSPAPAPQVDRAAPGAARGAGARSSVLGSDVPAARRAGGPAAAARACGRPASRSRRLSTRPTASPSCSCSPLGGHGRGRRCAGVRRALRAEELAGGGGRTSDALLVEAARGPGARGDAPAGRASGSPASPASSPPGATAAARPGADAQTVLWALWSAAGLAEPWRRQRSAGGAGGGARRP